VRAFGPALPGHNETPEQLARTRHQDWVGAAREHVTKLRSGHERVFAVGMSMGGLVSLALASEGAVDALVVVGTPLRLPRLARWTLPVLKYMRPFLPKRQGSDVREREAWARHPSYTVTPLRSAHELVRLGRRVIRGLPDVTCPILVAHGAHDRTAHPRDTHAIHEGVGSDVRELLILERSGHVVPVDHDGPELARASGDFLTRFL
jgi:carboxylesterase